MKKILLNLTCLALLATSVFAIGNNDENVEDDYLQSNFNYEMLPHLGVQLNVDPNMFNGTEENGEFGNGLQVPLNYAQDHDGENNPYEGLSDLFKEEPEGSDEDNLFQ